MSDQRDDADPLPCPSPELSIALTADARANQQSLAALPAKPGVIIVEDRAGAALTVLQSADIRRAAQTRLGEPEQPERATPRADLRPFATRVQAMLAGSSFEADWALLQLARVRLPHSYKSMLDRWHAWFVQCHFDERFPQWVKTAQPRSDAGVHVGPIADKHAAARFRDMLEDAFDLCRYHHILVQAPRGNACAYKEMGRCPAPCDGSVSMEHYHAQIMESIQFARDPMVARTAFQEQMQQEAADQDYESAARTRRLLDATSLCTRREFAHVRDLEEFRFIVVTPSIHLQRARVFAITGGWIEPMSELEINGDDEALRHAADRAAAICGRKPALFEAAVENIGMVCRHLLAPKAQARRRRAEFVSWTHARDDVPGALRRALAVVLRPKVRETDQPPHHDIEADVELE